MQRVTISVDEGWWKAVRIKALEGGETVSGFIQGLYKIVDKTDKVEKTSKVEKSDISQKTVKPVVVEVKAGPVEKSAVDLRAAWRAKHPNDMCRVCGELNKNCKCEGSVG